MSDPEIAAFSPADMMVVFIVALVVFGPKRLPELGKQLGHAMRELRKMTEEVSGVWQGTHDDLHTIIHTDPGVKKYDQAPPPAATPMISSVKPADDVAVLHNDENVPDNRRVFSTLPPPTGDKK